MNHDSTPIGVPHNPETVLAGTRLEPRRVARLVYGEGWRDLKAIQAVAICFAESQAYTKAVGPENPDGTKDYGIWQINSRHIDAGLITEAECYDPVRATEFAYTLYQRRSYTFNPWAAWTSGRWEEPEYLTYATRGYANMWRTEWAMPMLVEKTT